MKVALIYFPLSILLTVFASAEAAIVCPDGQFPVKAQDKKTISLIRKDVRIQDKDFSNNVKLFLFQKESLSKNPQIIKYLEKIIR